MGVFRELFSWWSGNTIGNRLFTWRKGRQVGEDQYGNRYYVQRRGVGPLGVPRRWVVYQHLAEASKVPPEWHSWLHHTDDTIPTDEDYRPAGWQLPHQPNLTGTSGAYRPQGSILTPESRPAATGDYEAWRPE